ncbi:MAG TPA: hypothetical protein VMC08_02860, partial [Bacteroidales bacterium]|nr:hypothetical protein [Bacteroidales bacterium]
MEETLFSFLHYILRVLVATGIQLLVLLGPLLLLALLMELITRQIGKLGPEVFGYRTYVYGFKWLGTPVHELGHALFALLFLHKITDIKLFDPKASGGMYGYVNHRYHPGNIYQEIGRFFIGIGPILLGSLVLFLSCFFLFRVRLQDLHGAAFSLTTVTQMESLKGFATGMMQGILRFVQLVFGGENTAWWKILILGYLLFSVGSSLTLSPPDIKDALAGFLYFVALLLIFNLVTLWIGNFATTFLTTVSAFFSGFYLLMILSILVNGIFVLLLAMLAPLLKPLKRKVRG